MVLFVPATTVDDASYVLVVPPSNRGKAALVPVVRATTMKVLQITFQRQVYLYTPSSLLGDDGAKEYPNGVFMVSSCPTDRPLSEYTTSKGIQSDSDVELMLERWGRNHLGISPSSSSSSSSSSS